MTPLRSVSRLATKSRALWVAVIIPMLLLSAACREDATPTPLPTATPSPTATFAPTATPAQARLDRPTSSVATSGPAADATLVPSAIEPTPYQNAPPSPQPTATPTRIATPEPTATPAPPPTPQSPATPTPNPTPVPFSVTITDSNGQDITFDKPPERIVAYSSTPVEMLFAMGEGNRIVGTHDFATYPPETEDIPKIGDAFNINQEKIVELEPDLIFTFYSGSLADLEGLGTKVLYLETPSDLAGIEERIRMWGAITDNVAGAEEVAQEFKTRVEALEEQLASVEEGPRVFQDNSSFWSPGPDTLVGGLYTLLKAQNIAHDTSGYTQFSPEVIVERDPQVIIVTFPDTLQVYQDDPAFQDISAVKQGRVHAINADILSIAGPRIIAGIEELAKLIHPELFD